MKKIIMSAIAVATCVPLHGITITFKQVEDLLQRQYVIKRTFSTPVRQGYITTPVSRSKNYTLDETNNELILNDLNPNDVIVIQTYVAQPPRMDTWALQPKTKKFRVTQEMDESVITLNCNTVE